MATEDGFVEHDEGPGTTTVTTFTVSDPCHYEVQAVKTDEDGTVDSDYWNARFDRIHFAE